MSKQTQPVVKSTPQEKVTPVITKVEPEIKPLNGLELTIQHLENALAELKPLQLKLANGTKTYSAIELALFNLNASRGYYDPQAKPVSNVLLQPKDNDFISKISHLNSTEYKDKGCCGQ
jgi:hypothetical protein